MKLRACWISDSSRIEGAGHPQDETLRFVKVISICCFNFHDLVIVSAIFLELKIMYLFEIRIGFLLEAAGNTHCC